MNRLSMINRSAGGDYPVVSGAGIAEAELEALWHRHLRDSRGSHDSRGSRGSRDSHDPYDRACIVVDAEVLRLHEDRIRAIQKQIGAVEEVFVVPSGESSKSLSMWERGVDYLLRHQVSRRTPVVAVGGGVTGDLAGFMASAVLRGVPLIHIPTTLLAMADSSIGGKTGVNHASGKNLIGAFHTPDAVIQDLDFLKTLPPREWVNGLSEVLKSGLIADRTIVDDAGEIFTGNGEPGWEAVADPDRFQTWLFRCAEIKCEITSDDEFESGRRAFLNFGHTMGHAMEKMFGYNRLRHGEAVFLGMIGALFLSAKVFGRVAADALDPFARLYEFDIRPEELDTSSLISYMALDKKRAGSTVRFVLLEDWEKPTLQPVDSQLIAEAVDVIRRSL